MADVVEGLVLTCIVGERLRIGLRRADWRQGVGCAAGLVGCPIIVLGVGVSAVSCESPRVASCSGTTSVTLLLFMLVYH